MNIKISSSFTQVLLALLLGGCCSIGCDAGSSSNNSAGKRWGAEARLIGIAESEIAEVVGLATERYKLVLIRVAKADNGGIAIYLADKPNRPHGIVVVYRKIDGHWHEDPKSRDEWII